MLQLAFDGCVATPSIMAADIIRAAAHLLRAGRLTVSTTLLEKYRKVLVDEEDEGRDVLLEDVYEEAVAVVDELLEKQGSKKKGRVAAVGKRGKK